jgi:uncharacterized protein (TIGR03067 family)
MLCGQFLHITQYRIMGRLLACNLVLVCLIGTFAPEHCVGSDAPTFDADLIGTWEMERAVHGMHLGSSEEPRHLPNPTTLTFYEDWYLLQSPQAEKRFLKLKCHLDKSPRQFDVWFAKSEEEATAKTSRPPDVRGIYEIRGDRLWRCYASSKQERPNSFDVLGHDGWTLTVHRPGVER